MEQRPLRVGDNVDDYCPRERRTTNHIIVALVGSVIRQTRCSTCEVEHVFKAGRPPRLRARSEPGATGVEDAAAAHSNSQAGQLESVPEDANGNVASAGGAAHQSEGEDRGRADMNASPNGHGAESVVEPTTSDGRGDEVWFGHRPLIRATLPKTEGDQPTPRPIPEFTMHQRNVRGAHAFRQGQPWHDRPSDGRGGPRHGTPSGNGSGNSGDDGIGNSFRHGGPGPGPGQGNGRPGGGGRRRRRGRRKPGGPI